MQFLIQDYRKDRFLIFSSLWNPCQRVSLTCPPCLTNNYMTKKGLTQVKNEKSPWSKSYKYLRQFHYSYWWRARHMGGVKPLIMTSKKCWNMDVTREHTPVLIRQFIHSYWSRATAETVVPHHKIRAQHSFIRSCLLEGGGGLYHFMAGGVLCWKKSFNNYNFCIYFTIRPKSDVFDRKRNYEWESKCVESVFN